MENSKYIDYSKLIIAVRNEEELWNPALPKYKDILFRNERWKQISVQIMDEELAAPDLQAEWKRLHEKYVREKKKLEKSGKSGSAGGITSKWEHFEEMRFVDSVYKNKSFSTLKTRQTPSKTNTESTFAHNLLDVDVPSPDYELISSNGVEAEFVDSSRNISELVEIARSLAPKQSTNLKYKEFSNYVASIMIEFGEDEAKILENVGLQAISEIRKA